MKLAVLAVGKLKEAWVQEGCAEYAKRVRGKLPLDLVEVKDDVELVRKIPPRYKLWALDERGKELTSDELAQALKRAMNGSEQGIALTIGGADGLPRDLVARADFVWSLGRADVASPARSSYCPRAALPRAQHLARRALPPTVSATMNRAPVKRTVLVVLDGFGERAETDGNAIRLARTPAFDALYREFPHTLINTSGLAVGLPEGQMGNSEVGHMNMGAGRIVYQELMRINKSISDGDFFKNRALVAAIDKAKATGKALHLFGLTSPGGVHSSLEHAVRASGAGQAARLDEGLRARVPRRARHAAEERRGLPAPGRSSKLLEDRRRPHRDGRRALLRHGPRQALGPRAAGLRCC